MTTVTAQPVFSPAVAAAIDTIVAELGLKAAERAALEEAVAELATPRPKLPHVSFYRATTRAGGISYQITYRVPGHRPRTERLGKLPGPAYKRARQVSEVLQQVKARLMSCDDAYRVLYVDNTPITKHLADFEQSLRAKRVNDNYLRSTIERLRRCCELGGYARLRDITRASLPRLTERLSQYSDPYTGRRLSAATVNKYLEVLRQFTKWATPSRLSSDPLVNTGGVRNVDSVKRRDVLPEELAAIVCAARAGRAFDGMSGEMRAMIYLTAFGTGLRRGELAALKLDWLKLDENPPVVLVPGRFTKNRKDATQPLPSWLVIELKKWIGDRTDGPLFPGLSAKTADALDRDREAARRAWVAQAKDAQERARREASDFLQRQTSEGVLVFHSLRHAYASQLVASGMDVKSVQMLTRHSTVSMLGDRYAHTRLAKAAQGMEQGLKNPLALTGEAAEYVAGSSDGQQKTGAAQSAAQSDV